MFERHLCSFVERLVAFAILQLARGSYYVSDLIPSNMFLSVMHRQKKKVGVGNCQLEAKESGLSAACLHSLLGTQP